MCIANSGLPIKIGTIGLWTGFPRYFDTCDCSFCRWVMRQRSLHGHSQLMMPCTALRKVQGELKIIPVPVKDIESS